MLDIDKTDYVVVRDVLWQAHVTHGLTFRIYRTYGGFHVFVTSGCLTFSAANVIGFMTSLGCDELYAMYASRNGYRVRTTPKAGREESGAVRVLVEQIGEIVPECQPYVAILETVVDDHDNLFFSSFVTLLRDETLRHHSYTDSMLFRESLIQRHGRSVEVVFFLQRLLGCFVQKPQRCLVDDEDFYIGVDLYTRRHYICFRQLAMVDIDFQDASHALDTMEQCLAFLAGVCHKDPSLVMHVVGSQRGCHVFLVDKPRDFHSRDTIQLLLSLQCDLMYATYCSLHGFSVRLDRKPADDKSKPIYVDYGWIGNMANIDPTLQVLGNSHFAYTYTLTTI